MMRRIRPVSQKIPEMAVLPRSDWGPYKDCINAQTTLSGKKDCTLEYIATILESGRPS